MCFVFAYENKTMKLVEIVLGGWMRENMEGVNLIKLYCKHTCK
jgi:hypothetical protein